METEEFFDSAQQFTSSGLTHCKICGHACEDSGHICNDCREKYIHYPIPKKVLIPVIIVVCILAVFLCTHFPRSLKAGIYYERAIKSMKEKNYVDAQNELEKAYAIFRDSPEITGNLVICNYMNVNTTEMFQLMDEIVTKKMKFHDDKLFQELSDIYYETYLLYDFPEEFLNNYDKISEMQDEDRITELNKYLQKYPDSHYIKILIAEILYDQKKYEKCEELVNQLMEHFPENVQIAMFHAAILREKGEFDKAEQKCMQFLEKNNQSAYILSSLSILELKRYNDKKALEYVEKAYSLQSDKFYILLDLARAYYYNNMEEELNTTMKEILNHPEAESYQEEMQKVKDIISGFIQWR